MELENDKTEYARLHDEMVAKSLRQKEIFYDTILPKLQIIAGCVIEKGNIDDLYNMKSTTRIKLNGVKIVIRCRTRFRTSYRLTVDRYFTVKYHYRTVVDYRECVTDSDDNTLREFHNCDWVKELDKIVQLAKFLKVVKATRRQLKREKEELKSIERDYKRYESYCDE